MERTYGIGIILGVCGLILLIGILKKNCRDFAEFCGSDGGVSDLYVLLKFLLYIQGI